MAVFLFVGVLFLAGSVLADSGIARFVFTTDSQTIRPGELSNTLKIQAQDANGNEIKTAETIDLEFLSTSSTGEFLNSSANPVSTVMSKGTANRTFYYRDSTAGSCTLQIKARGRDSGTSWSVSQTITISGVAVPSSIATPTPVPAASAPPQSSSPSSPSLSGSSPGSKISADAGLDQTVMVSSQVHFGGSASGLKKEPLDAARFWWNFGDGETQEGKITTHIFRVPGTYIVGLHVSSGEYGASDYLTIRVFENKMRMARVLEGGGGYVQLFNPLNVESDIGDWILEDATGKKFFIPSKTKVAAGAEISFSNAVTGLLQTDGHDVSLLYPLMVQYPNGTVAFVYIPAATSSSPAPVVSAPPTIAMQSTRILSSSTSVHAVKTKPTHSFSKGDAKQDAAVTGTQSAAVSGGFSISSKILFAGAIGLSALGALGFFILKQFLIR